MKLLKLIKDLMSLEVRWKAIPQMYPTVAETMFQKIGMGLRQSKFAFTE